MWAGWGRREAGTVTGIVANVEPRSPPAYGESNYSVSDAGTLVRVHGDGFGVARFAGTLEWMDREGEFTQVSAREGVYFDARGASDGNRIATWIADTDGSDVWVLDPERGASARLTSDGASDSPVWSHDDSWVYFTRGAAASGDLWRRRADLSGPAELVLERPLRQQATDVSPDGSVLAFEEPQPGADSTAATDVWLLPLDGGGPFPLLQTDARESDARFSPDGNLIAYASDASGIPQIYVREIDSGRQALVSAGEARSFSPVWARDGRTLYYNSDSAIFEARVDVTETGLRVTSPTRLLSPGRSVNGPLDVDTDGRFLTMRRLPRDPVEQDAAEQPRILVTLHWFQELRRLAPRDR